MEFLNKNKLLKIVFTVTLFIICSNAYAQIYEYTYDNAGNRTQRLIIDISGMQTNNQNNATEIKSVIDDYEFVLFPNVTDGVLNITAEQDFMNLENRKIYIYDMKGMLLFEKDYLSINECVDFSQFATGTYLVNVRADDGYFAEWRILKK